MRVRQKAPILKWHGDEVRAAVRKELGNRLVAVGQQLLDQMRQNMSTPYPPASDPWQFPHLRTGNTRAGLILHIDRRKLRIEVRNTYLKKGRWPIGQFLEEGTSRMEPRPHMVRTLNEALLPITKFMLKPIPGERSVFRFFRKAPTYSPWGYFNVG